MNVFDPKKPCQTRSGLKVVIYCTDAPGDFPIHGRFQDKDGGWHVFSWTIKGAAYAALMCPSECDLINTPEVVEEWGNVYPSESYNARNYSIYTCRTKEEADKLASPSRIACIPIKFTKGEGL